MLISGVSFHQLSLLQSSESDVLSYSECKIAKNFQGFAPGPHWGGLTAPPQTARLHNGFSTSEACWKTGTLKKLLDMALLSSSLLNCSKDSWKLRWSGAKLINFQGFSDPSLHYLQVSSHGFKLKTFCQWPLRWVWYVFLQKCWHQHKWHLKTSNSAPSKWGKVV